MSCVENIHCGVKLVIGCSFGYDYSFLICSSMLWWTLNFNFEVTLVVQLTSNNNYSFLIRFSTLLCNTNDYLEKTEIIE